MNSWEVAKVHSVKIGNRKAFLISFRVSNLDAALMGGSVKVNHYHPRMLINKNQVGLLLTLFLS